MCSFRTTGSRLYGWLCRSGGLQNILKNSKSRFGDYIAVVPTLIHTLVIIVKLVAIGFSTG